MRNGSRRNAGDEVQKWNFRWLWCSCVLLLMIASGSVPILADDATSAGWTSDAALRDVHFIDRSYGWAVGDRGVILKTTDGGRNWQHIESPVNGTLESVYFINDRLGWICGGVIRPVTHLTDGIVLFTSDGGVNWRRVSTRTLPWLTQIHMTTNTHGWAIGSGSPMYPSGLMTTSDGGQTWIAYPGDPESAMTRGAQLGQNRFAMIGRNGATVARGAELEQAFVLGTSPKELHDLVMVDDRHGWAVGSSGALLFTRDSGFSWDETSLPPAEALRMQFNWRAVEARGNNVWMVGSPGSAIVRSLDQGRSWEAVTSQTSFPLNDLCFVDEQFGCAVGDGGTIQVTTDAGTTWQVVRTAGERVAVLCIQSDRNALPLEFYARHAGNDGRLMALHFDRSEQSMLTDPIAERALRSVCADVGISGMTQSVVAGNEEITGLSPFGEEGSFSINQGAPQELSIGSVEQIVKSIRVWRPEIIMFDPGSLALNRPDAIQHLIEAVDAAADSTQFPAQIDLAGLDAWRATKVYVRVYGTEEADDVLPIDQLAPKLATSLEDFCLIGHHQLVSDRGQPPRDIRWRMIDSTLADVDGFRSLFAGIPPATLERLERDDAVRTIGTLENMRRQANKWDAIQRILVTAETKDDVEAWLQGVDGMLIGLGARGAGNALLQLSHAHQTAGQYEHAAWALLRLQAEFPNHPFSEAAITWLIRYYASAEARWNGLERPIEPHIQLASYDAEYDRGAQATNFDYDSPIGMRPDDPIRVPYSLRQVLDDRITFQIPAEQRGPMVRDLLQLANSRYPLLQNLPEVMVSYSASERMLGSVHSTRAQVISTARRSGGNWAIVGEIEEWLRKGDQAPPVPVVVCRPTAQPPRLDGKLDDVMWLHAPRIDIRMLTSHPLEGDATTFVRVTSDREFLFLAFEAVDEQITPRSDELESEEESRQRDVVLTDTDRIRFTLDIDRDFVTAFDFEVNRNGWIRDAILENDDWDPQWFVSTHQSDRGWVVEAAIPFSQLGIGPPIDRDAWHITIDRLQPGDASPRRKGSLLEEPKPSSLLMFEED